MSFTLSLPQISAARTWLANRGDDVKRDGVESHRQGDVGQAQPYRRGIGFRAVSRGPVGDYETKIRFTDGRWIGACTCLAGRDCKHAYALMLRVLEESDGTAATGTDAEKADGLRTADERFENLFRRKLGRDLSPEEGRAAATIEEVFQIDAQSAAINERRLDPLVVDRNGDGRDGDLPLWTQPPQDRWECWLGLATALHNAGRRLLPALGEVTSEADLDGYVAEQKRREDVAKWRRWFSKTAAHRRVGAARNVELRVRLTDEGAILESRSDGGRNFSPVKAAPFAQMVSEALAGRLPIAESSLPVWHAFYTGYGAKALRTFDEPDTARILNTLLRLPDPEPRVAGLEGEPLRRADEPLTWKVDFAEDETKNYRFALRLPDGRPPAPPLIVLDGEPALYVTRDRFYEAVPVGGLSIREKTVAIPAAAIETDEGLAWLDRVHLPPPPRMAPRVRDVRLKVIFSCALEVEKMGTREWLMARVRAESAPGVTEETLGRDGWERAASSTLADDVIVRTDRTALDAAAGCLEDLRVSWNQYDAHWQRIIGKPFPMQFAEWLAALPPGIAVELDPLLATLRDAPVRAGVKLEVEEAGIDWFDLRIALDVADTTLTKAELKQLLEARGGFVRLGAKGWRRLQFEISDAEEAQLADLGLSAREFTSETQRLHALQLAGKDAARKMLGDEHAAVIERRAADIQTRVAPAVPPELQAELRPYQLAGFHFLAYLTANRFGGILADDMGLGKTVQTLAWLLWLRTQPEFSNRPVLVVCPKSVVSNWFSEAERFAPGLRIYLLAKHDRNAAALEAARAKADVVVANYTQLRLLEGPLKAVPWHAVVLDEAQSIKNPDSQTARAACALKTEYRLALSGTPIENRLLDLWSIMNFAMPGVLGRRANFTRVFDQKSDPFARRRLAARVRPFVLRRTKREVANDLPERIEEDLLCEFDGPQATLYRAELKRARASLLKITTTAQLDRSRFNILTSLLRLRQICCHPSLVRTAKEPEESTKLSALLDLLEPLMEEGHKV
ncbi:MAG: DEAD/DEAH box helicase, partial [Chthoniobacteraceae bacterium]